MYLSPPTLTPPQYQFYPIMAEGARWSNQGFDHMHLLYFPEKSVSVIKSYLRYIKRYEGGITTKTWTCLTSIFCLVWFKPFYPCAQWPSHEMTTKGGGEEARVEITLPVWMPPTPMHLWYNKSLKFGISPPLPPHISFMTSIQEVGGQGGGGLYYDWEHSLRGVNSAPQNDACLSIGIDIKRIPRGCHIGRFRFCQGFLKSSPPNNHPWLYLGPCTTLPQTPHFWGFVKMYTPSDWASTDCLGLLKTIDTLCSPSAVIWRWPIFPQIRKWQKCKYCRLVSALNTGTILNLIPNIIPMSTKHTLRFDDGIVENIIYILIVVVRVSDRW